MNRQSALRPAWKFAGENFVFFERLERLVWYRVSDM
jgi:hypothetical protein